MKIIDANACIGHDFVKHEIVNHESFIVTQEAVKKIEEVYA